MKKLTLFFLLLFLLISCNKDDAVIQENPEEQNFEIKADKTNVMSLQFITLALPESINLNNEKFSAKFGNDQIALIKIEENKLGFFVPDLPSNTYNLVTEIDGKKSSLIFYLNAIPNIDNIDAFIDTELMSPLREQNKIANEVNSDQNSNIEIQEILEFGNEIYLKAIELLEQLTTEEKQILRKYFIANEISITDSDDLVTGKTETFDLNNWYKNLEDEQRKFVRLEIQVGGLIGATIAILFAPPPFDVISTLPLVKAMYKFKALLETRKRLLDLSFHPFDVFLTDIWGSSEKMKSYYQSSGTYDFQVNIYNNLTIGAKARNLQKSDISNANALIATTTSSINKGDKLQNDFKEKVDKVISTIGSLLNIKSNKIRETQGLPDKGEEIDIVMDNSYFSIENLPNTITPILSNDLTSNLKLKFSTKDILPISFDTSLKYDDGVFKFNSDFKVNLKANINLAGNLDFGEVDVNKTENKIFTISNNLKVPITITTINFPNGFSGNWTNGTISAESSQDVIVIFKPKEEKDYSGTIGVTNSLDETLSEINIQAKGINGALGKWDFSLILPDGADGPGSGGVITSINIDLSRPDITEPWMESFVLSPTDEPARIDFNFNYDITRNLLNCTIYWHYDDPDYEPEWFRYDSFSHELTNDLINFTLNRGNIGPEFTYEGPILGTLLRK
ncbi:MAG: hypothetical protein ACKVJF_07050 [Flavobacteriales bacterium]